MLRFPVHIFSNSRFVGILLHYHIVGIKLLEAIQSLAGQNHLVQLFLKSRCIGCSLCAHAVNSDCESASLDSEFRTACRLSTSGLRRSQSRLTVSRRTIRRLRPLPE